MKLAYAMPAAIVIAALSTTTTSAQSSTTRFACDSPEGRFSEFKMPVQATSFRVVGTVQPVIFRDHEQMIPMAAVRLRNAETNQSMTLRFAAANSQAEGAFVTYAFDNGDGQGEQRGDVGTLAINNVVNFGITYNQGGQSLFTVGEQAFPLGMELGTNFDMAIGCSTGDFIFDQLGWQFGAPASQSG